MTHVSTNYAPRSLGWWMNERRGELGLRWEDVAERAGVSPQTLYRISDPNRIRVGTRKGIERALRWQSGSIESIAEGGEPTPLPDEPETPEPADEISELREMARSLQEQAEASTRLADQLLQRIDRLSQSGEQRSAR